MKTVRIDVTQDCIDLGRRRGSTSCPVAIAANRAGLSAFVFPRYMCLATTERLDNPVGVWIGIYFQAGLPEAASKFVSAFDRRDSVEPFSFYIEVPE